MAVSSTHSNHYTNKERRRKGWKATRHPIVETCESVARKLPKHSVRFFKWRSLWIAPLPLFSISFTFATLLWESLHLFWDLVFSRVHCSFFTFSISFTKCKTKCIQTFLVIWFPFYVLRNVFGVHVAMAAVWNKQNRSTIPNSTFFLRLSVFNYGERFFAKCRPFVEWEIIPRYIGIGKRLYDSSSCFR